jgi:hypothetical protein
MQPYMTAAGTGKNSVPLFFPVCLSLSWLSLRRHRRGEMHVEMGSAFTLNKLAHKREDIQETFVRETISQAVMVCHVSQVESEVLHGS